MQKKSLPKSAIPLVFVALLAGGIYYYNSQNKTQTITDHKTSLSPGHSTGISEKKQPKADVSSTSLVKSDKKPPELISQQNKKSKKQIEQQPRKFHVIDLSRSPGTAKKVSQGNDGIRLSIPQTADNPRRVGTFESDPIQMDFPSNSLSPLWKGETPEGTEVTIELAMSQDGDNWSPWKMLHTDGDAAGNIRETYPDGRPNPNYGFNPSGMVSYGLSTWKYTRYRINLYSEVSGSPSVQALRLFYQDTTLGKGHLADPAQTTTQQ